MSLSDYQNALVTGASSGIGAALVKTLSQQNLEVHAVARRMQRLKQLAQTSGCHIHVLDLQDSEQIYQLGSQQDWDILINNAGILRGLEGIDKVSAADIDHSIDTNIRAVYHLLRSVLPGMIKRRRGHIINIGSMAGLYALQSSVYGGSKGAIHMISRNLRLELQGSGVRVTEICPGRVSSEIYDQPETQKPAQQSIEKAELASKIKNSQIRELDPEDIAAAVMYAIDSPWYVNVNRIELQPTEQTYGGSQFVPLTNQPC